MFFIDVQGTLLSDSDKSLINGARELILLLNQRQIPYVIITNNTKDLNLLSKLRQKGLEIKQNAYIDPFIVLESFLKPCKIAAFGSKEFQNALVDLGFELDFKAPAAVAVASFDDFKFSDFALMIELAKEQLPFFAMHKTSIYKKNHRLYPGVGAIMAMIEYATSLKYEVIGKPSKAFYEAALKLLKNQDKGAKFENTFIISDDFKGDLVGAKALKMKTALVLSGKISDTKALDTSKLDFVYKDINEFLQKYVIML